MLYKFSKYDVPTIDDFWKHLQMSSLRETYFANRSVKGIMSTWMESNYPIIYVRTAFSLDGEDIVVTIRQENNERLSWHKWWILISWFTDTLISYAIRITPSLCKWLNPHDIGKTKILTSLDNSNGWIILNTKQSGKYVDKVGIYFFS